MVNNNLLCVESSFSSCLSITKISEKIILGTEAHTIVALTVLWVITIFLRSKTNSYFEILVVPYPEFDLESLSWRPGSSADHVNGLCIYQMLLYTKYLCKGNDI